MLVISPLSDEHMVKGFPHSVGKPLLQIVCFVNKSPSLRCNPICQFLLLPELRQLACVFSHMWDRS